MSRAELILQRRKSSYSSVLLMFYMDLVKNRAPCCCLRDSYVIHDVTQKSGLEMCFVSDPEPNDLRFCSENYPADGMGSRGGGDISGRKNHL